jgi:Rieske 2Fe-2S family protein
VSTGTGTGQPGLTLRQAVPAAPLDPAALADVLRPFGESRMLPPAAYVDPAVFEWEQRHFFGGGWLCAGLSCEVAEPGDQRAEAAGHGSVLLARGRDGRLRAFANTCRHRGHELLPCGTAAKRQAIVCPYHSWAYGLDGRLRAAPDFPHQPGSDAAGWALAELPVTEWHGLVFVDGSGHAPPLAPALASLERLVAPYAPQRLKVAARQVYEVAANWKILTENYHECCHCPAIHPELCRVSPPRSGENYRLPGTWVGGRMGLREGVATMSVDGTSRGVPLPGLSGDGLRTVIYVGIFPNVLLSLHPDYVMTHRLNPLSAGRTVIECAWAFAPEAVASPQFDPGYAVGFWDVTNRQDWRACESVQRGLTSPHASPGPLSSREDAVYQFVTMIARGYLGQPVWNPGEVARAGSPGPGKHSGRRAGRSHRERAARP